MAEQLIVNLEEFAELCGVTPETMRGHVRAVDGAPGWLIERGDRGRGYKIEAEGGLKWWQDKREDDERVDQVRRDQLAQLRLEVVGDAAEEQGALSLSGRQRREEYAAAMDAIKYRKTLGQLVETHEIRRGLSALAVEHRRRLQNLAPEFGIAVGLPADQVRTLEGMIERAVDAFVTAVEDPKLFMEG